MSFSDLVAAGINLVPAAIVVLGIGTLAHGRAPRLAGAIAYGVVAWSFIVEILSTSIGGGRWLLHPSVVDHLARAPATDVRWGSLAAQTAIGLASAALGALGFARRDLQST